MNSLPPIAAVHVASPAEQARYESEQRRRAEEIIAARPSCVPMLFLRDHSTPERGGWIKGEVAGFPAAEAAELERAGVATRNLDSEPAAASKASEVGNDGLVAVKFLREWKTYVAGDKAGFPRETAGWLNRKGIAAPVDLAPLRRTLASIRAAILG